MNVNRVIHKLQNLHEIFITDIFLMLINGLQCCELTTRQPITAAFLPTGKSLC